MAYLFNLIKKVSFLAIHPKLLLPYGKVGHVCLPKLARLIISAQVFNTRPFESTTDWLKFNPFKLNAIVDNPKAVNQIPITGQAAKKKCNERELLNALN